MSDAPRKLPRQPRSRETVEVVLEAAAQMFDREGFSTTTNRIAERAGISIGSLYQYFPNKQALLYALAQRHVQAAIARLDEVLARLRHQQPPWDVTLRTILDEVIDLHSDRPALHGLMHRIAPRGAADLAVLQQFEDRIADELAYHLQRCGRGGDDPQETAQTVVHAVDAHLHRVLTRRKLSTDQLLAHVEQLLPN